VSEQAPQAEGSQSSQPAAGSPAGPAASVGTPGGSTGTPASGVCWGTGRRKSAVARVRLMPGNGKILVNNRELEDYFTELKDRLEVLAPLQHTGKLSYWNAVVNVRGGGPSGQGGAIRLGIARALVAADPACEPALRDAGFLTRDARVVERKKYGRRKARRRFQFSKR
jgi:small subunit ribosomal protein S9